MNDPNAAVAHLILEHIRKLHDAPEPPAIPDSFADDEAFVTFHNKLLSLRRTLTAFANGDFSQTAHSRGYLAGACKALQAHLSHLVWKVQQIEKGDYTQRVDFLGEFSSSFNNMVIKLGATITELQQKEEALSALAVSLQEEARRNRAILMELKKSEAQFKHLAQHDPLTGCLNRRSFFPLAEAKLQSALSLGKPCCVCLLDIDHFKRFNDVHGHVEGDQALKHVVAQSTSSLRQSDILGRYGGEDFIFFFPGTTLQQGYAAAERIRTAIEKTPLMLANGTLAPLTASIGIVEITESPHNDPIEELLKYSIVLADAALYDAKTNGRNRTCSPPLMEKGQAALKKPTGHTEMEPCPLQ